MPDRRTRARWILAALLLAASMPGVPLLSAQAALADPVRVADAPVPPRGADPEKVSGLRRAPVVDWPVAGAAVANPAPATAGSAGATGSGATPALARAGTLPVRVGNADGAPVRVELLDRAATAKAGVSGLLLRLGHPDGRTRPIDVEVDYSGFRHAYGGDYGSRLRLVRMPDDPAGTPAPVPTRNSAGAGLLRATVTDGRYAVTADTGGSTGDFKPTTLAPSATWQVGLQSGDFEWTYPIGTPPVPGPAPDLALSYSSGAVDGRTASTNNQTSWVGEGFDLRSGYIERSYRPCREDGQTSTIGDLCWASPNSTVTLPGLVGELVWDEEKEIWRAERDQGWRVELLTGAVNGDDNGEHWRLTAPDGTRYFFGLNRLPEWHAGNPETRSAWTVPVFGNQTGEPCHAGTFAASWCQQAYRWNLDFVIDRHGDVLSHHYTPESNYYGRNGSIASPTPYVRGGVPSRIDYGQRIGSVYSTPPAAQVVFTAQDRCVPGTACTRLQPQNWPDVPLDQWCDGGSCAVLAPTFWSTKRLGKVTTRALRAGTLSDVDSWALTHAYPVPSDGTSAALWLESVVRSGHLGAVTQTMPPVTFDGEQLANRVDAPDLADAMYKRRLRQIYTETGGQISVAYRPRECVRSALPAVDQNDRRCFPAIWGTSAVVDWFHKYVVSEVARIDRVGGNPTQITAYEYEANGPAWHHDDAELVPAGRKSWGQWRGYEVVRERTGTPNGPSDVTEHMFLRGMDGDLLKNGGRRSVTVDGVPDRPWWRGFTRSSATYDGDGGAQLSRTVAEPTEIGSATARRSRPTGWLEARMTGVRAERTVTPLAAGGARTVEVAYEYHDGYGTLSRIDDRGDVAVDGDNTCTTLTYARDDRDWLVDAVSRETSVAVACGAEPTYPGDLITDRRYYHDGQSAWGAAPTAGDVTRQEEADSWSDGPVYVTTQRTTVDGHGRPIEQYDGAAHLTRTGYTPAVGGPVTRTVVTDPKGFTTTTDLDPGRGEPTSVVDANGGGRIQAHDPLGRLTRVWLPGRSTSSPPNAEYIYAVRADGPTAVTSRTLLSGTTYRTGYELYDGFLRSRQTQLAAPGGGRIVTDTRYDTRGRVAMTTGQRYDPGAPGSMLVGGDDTAPTRTGYEYDGAGRVTAEIFLTGGTERWRTTTSHLGDRTTVDPPTGGTATTTLTDGRGRVVELRQHHADTPSGAYDAMRYTYTPADEPATVTDSVGNAWRYGYDLRGRQVRAEAPDTGTVTSRYDVDGRVLSTTDARGRTLAHTYDELGRMTGRYEGSPDGRKLAEWTYDSAVRGKGLPASSTRYADGAYRSEVTGYDNRGRRTGTLVTIPAGEGGLAGTYPTTFTYNEVDAVVTTGLPGVGGLPAETLQTGYDGLGLPVTLRGGGVSYVQATGYTELAEPQRYTLGSSGAQVTREFSYEPGTRRLSGTATRIGTGTPLSQVGYRYDASGGITGASDTATGDHQCFRYDHLRRLTEAWTPASADCAAAPATAGLGGPADYWHSYTFDATGNRRGEVRHAGSGDTTRAYTHPPAGTAQPHTLLSAGPDTYRHDAAGNQVGRTVDGQAQVLTWDAEGHLESVTGPGGTTSFRYDADGNRLIRRDPDGSTLYLGDTELRSGAGTLTGTRYYRHGSTAVAVRVGGALSWLGSDLHGTPDLAVSAANMAVTRRFHLPYGASRGPAPANWPGEMGFVGGVRDASTGLIHLGAREYDPAVGRFVSADPIIDHDDPQQMHGYAYANNSPLTYTDPDGLLLRPSVGGEWGAEARRATSRPVPPPPRTAPRPVPPPTRPQPYQGIGMKLEAKNPLWLWHHLNGRAYLVAQSPQPIYALQERGCGGWTQCITPRPSEMAEVGMWVYDPVPYPSPVPVALDADVGRRYDLEVAPEPERAPDLRFLDFMKKPGIPVRGGGW